MKTLFIYITASHDSSVVKRPEIIETLNKAKNAGFEKIIIIKKTQIVSKIHELEEYFQINPYPKASFRKAINNSDGCLIVNDGIGIRRKNGENRRNRKNRLIEKIQDEANKKYKAVMYINIPL